MVFDALGVLVVRQVLARVRFLALGSRLQAFTVEQYWSFFSVFCNAARCVSSKASDISLLSSLSETYFVSISGGSAAILRSISAASF